MDFQYTRESREGARTTSKTTEEAREAQLLRKHAWIWTDARPPPRAAGANGGLLGSVGSGEPKPRGGPSADPSPDIDEPPEISPRSSSTDTAVTQAPHCRTSRLVSTARLDPNSRQSNHLPMQELFPSEQEIPETKTRARASWGGETSPSTSSEWQARRAAVPPGSCPWLFFFLLGEQTLLVRWRNGGGGEGGG